MKNKYDQLPHASLIRILELTEGLSDSLDLPQMLDKVLQAGLDATQAASGSLWLHDDSQDIVEMHLPASQPATAVNAGEGLVGQCLAGNEVINITDCNTDPRFNPEVDQGTVSGTESILTIPLIGSGGSQVGVLQLLGNSRGCFDEQDEILVAALAAQSAVALQRTRLTEKLIAKERLDEEVEIAREIQLSTLPNEMPDIESYDFSGGFIPASHAGGDLYDLVKLGEEVFILMGDATGHGFGPALSATQMQAMLRVAFRVGADLDQAYMHVNNQLVEDLPDNRFLTAFIGFLDPETHNLRYHSGGQGPILHYHAADRRCEWFPPTSFPVGIMEFETVDPPQELALAPGDILAVISDGVYEYHNEQGEQFGEARVEKIFQEFSGSSMDDLKQQLLEEVYAFGGQAEQLDDITLVLVSRKHV